MPKALERAIASAALAAFPRECCGLIEGVREEGGFVACRIHPARNLSQAANRFEIDPKDHVAAVKVARSGGQAIIGCYHSHPGGAAIPSQRDLARAGEEDFLWLIAAADGGECEIAAFVYRGEDGFVPVSFSRAEGADLVTSSSNERS